MVGVTCILLLMVGVTCILLLMVGATWSRNMVGVT
jgi:hypothetical protein